MEKIAIILQARMGSTRLPGKVLKPINNHPLLWYTITRLKKVKHECMIILATTDGEKDKELIKFAQSMKIKTFAGSENDVLDRFYQAAKLFKPDIIIRITGDCPLIDPVVIDKCIDVFLSGKYDYVSNAHPPTYPDGLDTEILSMKVLEKIWTIAKKKSEREHVTPYIYTHPDEFKIFNVVNEKDLSSYRLTVDEQEDFELIATIIQHFGNKDFSTNEVIDFLEEHKKLLEINKKFERDEGYKKSLKEDKN